MSSVTDTISSLTSEEDNVCLLQQYEEYLIDMKRELAAILLSADYEDTGEFDEMLDTIEKGVFDCLLQVRKLLRSQNASTTSPVPDTKSSQTRCADIRRKYTQLEDILGAIQCFST